MSDKLTDREIVTAAYADAQCEFFMDFFERVPSYHHITTAYLPVDLGRGKTEAEAWQDARKKLEQTT